MIVGPVDLVPPQINEDFKTVLAWADDVRRLGIRANADTPADAKRAREFGAEGIGLCRTEHMFMDEVRLPADRGALVREQDLQAFAGDRSRRAPRPWPRRRADPFGRRPRSR